MSIGPCRGNVGKSPYLDAAQAKKIVALVDSQGLTFTVLATRFGVSRITIKAAYDRHKALSDPAPVATDSTGSDKASVRRVA